MFNFGKSKEQPEFGRNVGIEKVLCRFKWDYPIVNLMSGHIRNCCRTNKQVITQQSLEKHGQDAIMNSPYELKRRLEKIQGITHEDCASCVRLEKSGVRSPRSGVDGWVNDYWLKNDLGQKNGQNENQIVLELSKNMTLENPILKSKNPDMLEIVLGNICNLKCTYCSPHYSSLWAQELIKHGELTQEQYQKDFPTAPEELSKVFWEWFYDVARHSVRAINILGGEPTYMPVFYDVVRKLIDAYEDLDKKDHHRVELGVITNMSGSQVAIDRLISFMPEMGKHFLFHLQPSIEATHDRAEYIRYGLKWETLEKNVCQIVEAAQKLNLSPEQFCIGFQMALNTFSISSLPDFVKWVDQLRKKYNFEFGLMQNIVSFPRHHNPMILTPDYAKYVQETIEYIRLNEDNKDRVPSSHLHSKRWNDYRVYLLEGLYESMSADHRSDFDLESRKYFFEFVNKNDKRRGCDFLKTFPEMENFYNLSNK